MRVSLQRNIYLSFIDLRPTISEYCFTVKFDSVVVMTNLVLDFLNALWRCGALQLLCSYMSMGNYGM